MLAQLTRQFKRVKGDRTGGSAGSPLLDGTVWVFLADALVIPTGLLTVALLTRRFGPDGYGIFAIAAAFVAWIEWGLTSLFARVTIHLVGETRDWKPIAGALLRWHAAIGGLAMLLLWLLAPPIASLLDEPAFAEYLPLFALDIPLFMLAQGHRNVLTGVGRFRPRALASVGRWVGRLLLIALLVEWGLSIHGAILGCIGASLVELLICRAYIRPSVLTASPWLALPFPRSVLPLVLSAASLSCYTKLDLLALKALGGTAAQAGIYAAAQNLSILPGLFAQGFSALLLATLNRTLGEGRPAEAKVTASEAIRLAMGLLPIAGLFAGAAPGITELCFGPEFRSAAPLLAILIFGAIAQVMLAVAMTILTAAGKPGWTLLLAGPLVPLALVGHLILIPRLGLSGPAIVTTCVGLAGALAGLASVWRTWDIRLPAATLIRSVLLCGAAYLVASAAPHSGIGLLAKLSALSAALLVALWLWETPRNGNPHRLRILPDLK